MSVTTHSHRQHQARLIQLVQYEKSFGEDLGLRLVDSIERNAKHYVDVLSQAVDKIMPKESKEVT